MHHPSLADAASASEAPSFATGWGQADTRAETLSDGRPNPAETAGKPYPGITGREIVGLMRDPPSVPKERAQWFIPSTYREFDARKHDVQRERGAFWWLALDFDKRNPSLKTVTAVHEAVVPGATRHIYASRSCRPSACKWRVLLPLATPLAGADYRDTQDALFALLEEAGGGAIELDRALRRPAQLVYLPNRGMLYEFNTAHEGAPLNLKGNHPIIIRREETRRKWDEAAQEAAAERARKAAERRARASDGEVSPVDHFNGHHTVAELLVRYGYTQAGGSKDWRSPYQQSSSFATRDCGEFWISLSASDGAEGLGTETRNGHRRGDAFDLYRHLEHRGDWTAAVRTYAEEAGLNRKADDDVLKGLDEAVRQAKEEAKHESGGSGQSDAGGGHNDADPLNVWDAGDDDTPIPPRGWLLGTTFCRRFVSSLMADGGTGKTALRVAQLLALATGRPLTGEHVFRRCRVLLVSLEDDADELRRRVRAAMLHHRISASEVRGWLFVAAPMADAGKLAVLDAKGRVQPGPLGESLRATVAHRGLDLVSLDPFVKTHGLTENDNNQMDQVIAELARLAMSHDIAVDIPHHCAKGTTDPGNANRGRGASAVKDGARLVHTLTVMSQAEAERFAVPEAERRRYVRMDPGKVNIIPPASSATWFRLVSVALGNATEAYPAGDNVQTVEPWQPPDTWQGVSCELANRILDEIEAGKPDGERFSDHSRAGGRAAWQVVARHCPEKTEGQCREIVRTWRKEGVLAPEQYESPTQRKARQGLRVNPAKRPRAQCAIS